MKKRTKAVQVKNKRVTGAQIKKLKAKYAKPAAKKAPKRASPQKKSTTSKKVSPKKKASPKKASSTAVREDLFDVPTF